MQRYNNLNKRPNIRKTLWQKQCKDTNSCSPTLPPLITKELNETVVVRKFRITTQHGAIEGKTQSRNVAHCNLDVIIVLADKNRGSYPKQVPFCLQTDKQKSLIFQTFSHFFLFRVTNYKLF